MRYFSKETYVLIACTNFPVCCQALLPLSRQALLVLVVPHKLPVIHCDNTSTVVLAHSPIIHARTKHMELDLFFVGEKVLNKLLQVVYVLATSQYADILTKALSPSDFEVFSVKLTLCDPSNSSWSHRP